jgi:hypothetical protein
MAVNNSTSPYLVLGRRGTLAERFYVKLRPLANGCWEWIASSSSRGYGEIWDGAAGKNRKATHVSWELAHGKPFPAGMYACHSCDNPACVNPEHIFVGSQKDNLRDASDKKRLPAQSKTHCKSGHPLSGANMRTIPNSNGRARRQCIQCDEKRKRDYSERRRIRNRRINEARESL